MPPPVDLNTLSSSICRGIQEGNAPLVQVIAGTADKRHELRGQLQTALDKMWEHDGEMKFLKGVIVSLTGNGDGSTGMVPGLQRDMKVMGGEMASLQNQMGQVRTDVSGIREDIRSMRVSQTEQKSWVDGWKGVGVAVGLIGTCLTVIGSLIAGTVWLFTHAGTH